MSEEFNSDSVLELKLISRAPPAPMNQPGRQQLEIATELGRTVIRLALITTNKYAH